MIKALYNRHNVKNNKKENLHQLITVSCKIRLDTQSIQNTETAEMLKISR